MLPGFFPDQEEKRVTAPAKGGVFWYQVNILGRVNKGAGPWAATRAGKAARAVTGEKVGADGRKKSRADLTRLFKTEDRGRLISGAA